MQISISSYGANSRDRLSKNEPSGGCIYGTLSKDIFQKGKVSGKRQKKGNRKYLEFH